MKNLNSFLIIIGIYLSIQAVGLYVGYGLIGFFEVNPEYMTFQNPNDPAVSGQLFLYIIAMTAVLLLLMRYKLDIFIKILMAVAVISGLIITFQSFIGWTFAVIPAVVLFALNLKIERLLLRNATLILVISGIGAYLGANLGVIPCLLFLILLSIYDVIAVFGTKHMITLADEGRGQLPFLFTIPLGKSRAETVTGRVKAGKGMAETVTVGAETGKDGIKAGKDKTEAGTGEMEIGTGDFVIPLMFSVSLLADYNLKFALISAFCGLAGALALFFYALRKEHQALPALPPIAAGLIIGFGIALLMQ